MPQVEEFAAELVALCQKHRLFFTLARGDHPIIRELGPEDEATVNLASNHCGMASVHLDHPIDLTKLGLVSVEHGLGLIRASGVTESTGFAVKLQLGAALTVPRTRLTPAGWVADSP